MDAQQGVKKRPSSPSTGGSANASMGGGLTEICESKTEGACAPGGNSVPPKKLCFFRPVISYQVCLAVPESGPCKVSQQVCGFCRYSAHTHTGFTPVPSCGSSQTEVLSSACVNVPLALSCRTPSHGPGQPFPGSSSCLSFSDYGWPQKLHPWGPRLAAAPAQSIHGRKGKKKK